MELHRPRVFLVLLVLLPIADAADTCAWQNCPQFDETPGVKNVHLICHTHDDLGFIKTADQYYWGSRKNIARDGVQYIYNTVLDELEKDTTRRFSAAETGFIWRWMINHDANDQNRFKRLVQNGQIELVGGGWVQPDEAAAHYTAILDQHTLGLRYLSTWFGECGKPQTAWQIDPFGHSREVANLYALMGYKALYFAREHYLELQARRNNKSLDFMWQSSDDLKSSILTGAFYNSNYDPPVGLCWDDRACSDEPIMDNPLLEEYNLDGILELFQYYVNFLSSHASTNHIMMLMGADFQYTNANSWYTNLDKLIKYVNANSSSLGIRVFYSTPSCYAAAVQSHHNSSNPIPTKSDDFFPFATGDQSYWTGYFTSRPSHKLLVRRASAFLQLVRQLSTFANLADQSSDDNSAIGELDRAVGLTQHHDSITGTATEAVTQDYRLQVANGVAHAGTAVIGPAAKALAGLTGPVVYCALLNETRCAATYNQSAFTVTVFNALGHSTTQVVRFPFWGNTAIVKNATGSPVTAQLVRTITGAQWPTNVGEPRAPNELVFKATVPAAGFTSFSVATTPTSPRQLALAVAQAPRHEITSSKDGFSSTYIENEKLKVQLGDDGLVATVIDKSTGTTYKLRQYAATYDGESGLDGSQPAGAYIFRPTSTPRNDFATVESIQVVTGPHVNEIRQQFTPWISQSVRLEAGADFVTFDWTIGPIPSADKQSKEVVLRYETDIAATAFYTDANGRQTMMRRRQYSASYAWNDTQPIAGNYYPVTSRIHIQDGQTALAVLTDRSQGATAYNNTIELLVHRRCFYDDHFGVNEPLNEPGLDGKGLIARGQHRVLFGSPQNITLRAQLLAQEIFHAPELGFSGAASGTNLAQFAGLKADLPAEIHLATLQILDGGDILLRLEHVGESASHFGSSVPITVSLQNLFSSFTISSATELALAADRPSLSLVDDQLVQNAHYVPLEDDSLSVTLTPQQIRTFRLAITRP